MATSDSNGTGTVTVPASAMNQFIQQQVGLPTTFFLTMGRASIKADGSLVAQYTFSNQGTPPPPATTLALQPEELMPGVE